MQNKTLISLLERLEPDAEVCVEIRECITDVFVDSLMILDIRKMNTVS